MSETLLSIDGLQVRYGAIEAVKSLDLHIAEGERVTLIGANSAGKTSSLKVLTGLLPVAEGEIRFVGRSIRGTRWTNCCVWALPWCRKGVGFLRA